MIKKEAFVALQRVFADRTPPLAKKAWLADCLNDTCRIPCLERNFLCPPPTSKKPLQTLQNAKNGVNCMNPLCIFCSGLELFSLQNCANFTNPRYKTSLAVCVSDDMVFPDAQRIYHALTQRAVGHKVNCMTRFFPMHNKFATLNLTLTSCQGLV